jgi:diguanylate cyclase (GGDEF)-like protein
MPALGPVVRLALAAVVAVLAGMVLRRSREPLLRQSVGWAALHTAVLATGGLLSPLLPLAAAWVVWVRHTSGNGRAAPALVAGSLLATTELLAPGAPNVVALAGAALLVALAHAVPLGRLREPGPSRERHRDEALPAHSADRLQDADEEQVIAGACEIVRRATDAQEAALWTTDLHELRARRLGWAGAADLQPGASAVDLEGHPFTWPVRENVHVRLERGRRELPSAWATEMLLVPVPEIDGLLALAYPSLVPPEAEAAALRAGAHLDALLSLLRRREEGVRTGVALQALARAGQTLPGELQLDQFGRHLVHAVRDAVGGTGAALAVWNSETGAAEIVYAEGSEMERVRYGQTVADSASRLSLSAKHGVRLAYSDLRQEQDRLPLLVPGEQWAVPPRSAMLAPLVTGDATVGVVATWDPKPARFGEHEQEFLHTLCSLAAPHLAGAMQYQQLDRQASTDALTALPNRRTFESRFSAEASQFARYARPFSLIIFDVDHFKRFNDTWGHDAGDRVLQHVAQLVSATVRDVDLPARLGGEEFVVLMPETSLAAGLEAAERVRKTIEERSVMWKGKPLTVTASFGVAACPECTLDPDILLKLADTALYAAKAAGRNRVGAAPCSDLADA